MAQNKNIGKDSALITITQFMTLGVNMVNAMLLSRFRSLQEYGTYSQIIAICSVVITFMSAGFSQCINYFLGKCETVEEKQAFVKNYYSILSITSMFGGIISLLLLPILVNYFDNGVLERYWFVFLLYPVSHIMNSGTDRFFIAYKRARWLLFFKVGHSVAVLSEILVVLLFRWTFYQYMILYVMTEVLFGFSVFIWIRVLSGVVPIGINKRFVWRILKFAIPMSLASLVSSINSEIDKLVIGGLVDTETFAIYTNAAKELPVFILSTSISSVVMPHVVRRTAQEDYRGALKLWKSSMILSYYLICFCVTALVVFAPQVISLLYSDKYLPGVSVFRVYSLVLLFRMTYYGMMLNALGKTRTILKASVATMISNLILDFILYHFLGVIGPAIATLLSVAIMNMYQLHLTGRNIRISFTEIIPVRRILLTTALNAVMGVLAFCIFRLILYKIRINEIVLAVLVGTIWLFTYFVVIRRDITSIWNYLNRGEDKND